MLRSQKMDVLGSTYLAAQVVGLCLVSALSSCNQPATALLEDGRPRLPPLAADLRPEFGELYRLVSADHEQPLPQLRSPPATVEEHTAWVDGVLEPWSAARGDIGIKLNEARPTMPDRDPTVAYERAHLVHAALSATHSVDEAIARSGIPFPRELTEDLSKKDVLRQGALMIARGARRDVELWRSSCRYAGGEETVPEDLARWPEYCEALTAVLLAHACSREAAYAPDVLGEGCKPAG